MLICLRNASAVFLRRRAEANIFDRCCLPCLTFRMIPPLKCIVEISVLDPLKHNLEWRRLNPMHAFPLLNRISKFWNRVKSTLMRILQEPGLAKRFNESIGHLSMPAAGSPDPEQITPTREDYISHSPPECDIIQIGHGRLLPGYRYFARDICASFLRRRSSFKIYAETLLRCITITSCENLDYYMLHRIFQLCQVNDTISVIFTV
jgi:hypothetical protein